MASKAVGLTDAKIRGLIPPASGQIEVLDQLVSGLRVRVGASGGKTFILRKRVGGSVRNVTLGRFSDAFTLADARKKARSLLIDLESGKGLPQPAKSTGGAVGRLTFSVLWAQYLERAVRGKKKSASEIERIGKKFILPRFGDRLADTISRAEVTSLVEDITYRDPEHPTPRAGLGVHQQLSSFFTWAMPKLDKLPANPCRDAGRPPLPKARDRFLSNVEIRVFWQACNAMGWPFGPGFQLLLLTGQRRGEVFDASRSEFDGDTWVIPAARAKNGKAHIVPLSSAAQAILDELPVLDGSAKLFPVAGNKEASVNGFSKGHPRLLREMAKIMKVDTVEHFVLHDLRRTVATGMQRLAVPMPVTEAVLNHISGSRSGIAGVYQRYDYQPEKRAALDAWATEIMAIVGQANLSEPRADLKRGPPYQAPHPL